METVLKVPEIADAFSLETKYRLEAGRVFLTGIQALVRLPLDQHRADRRRGLSTATLISGYRGSPLGGLDQTVERQRDLMAEHHVVFISGVNEDLGAAAVFGSQLAHLYGRARYDGVLGMWYGKAPGVDRSGDILRHANFAGVGRHGGVLALAGVDRDLPEPELRVRRATSLFLMGIGGTGVVTVNQVLGTAALLDGKHVGGLDQTGLSQKGGPVVSHLRIADTAADIAGKIGVAEADVYLGFDLLVATAPPNLLRARPDLTIAVVSTTQVPTGAMVASTDVAFPDPGGLVAAINRVTRKDENVFVDALGLGEALFGDHMAGNTILLGAAYQAGAIPVRAAAIEQAIAINAVQVEMNTQAFRVGRLLVADPGWAVTVERTRAGAVAVAIRGELGPEARALVDSMGATGELRRLLEVRVPELIAYQDAGSARRYVEFVGHVAEAERVAVPGETRLAEAVARYLYKLMAYKDEYEVARLHLRPEVRASIRAGLGEAEVRYQLHPPVLRALGVKRKVSLGTWVDGAFRLLVALRRLRGTALDPFGYAAVRRVERALIGEYRGMVESALRDLTPASHERAVRIARLPDLVRGYEDVKLRSVRRFRDEARALGVGA